MSSPEAGVRAPTMTGIWPCIAAAGGDAERVFRRAGLDLSEIRDPSRWIREEQYRRVLEFASEATGDDCFALRVGTAFDLRNYGILGYATLNCATLGEAAASLVRYFEVMRKGARFTLKVEGETASVRFHAVKSPYEMPRHEAELALARLCKGIRDLVGSDWMPQRVHFAHQRKGGLDEHERFFGVRPHFGMDGNRVVLSRADMQRRNRAADQRLYQIMKHRLEALLPERGEDDLVLKVREEIAEALSEGASLNATAGRLGLGARTLQRRLRDRGLAYNDLVEQVRREESFRHLRHGDLQISEIAVRLGYSEVSAFDRAFRRWSGTSPLAFRQDARRGA